MTHEEILQASQWFEKNNVSDWVCINLHHANETQWVMEFLNPVTKKRVDVTSMDGLDQFNAAECLTMSERDD